MDNIKITPELEFDFKDLMEVVDTTQPFTLMDLFSVCKNSKIPQDILTQILQCDYHAFCEEAESQPFQDKGDIEHLELVYTGERNDDDYGDSTGWIFDGVGKEGVVSKDVPYDPNEPIPPGWRQRYAIELSPLYELSGYQVKIAKRIWIDDWKGMEERSKGKKKTKEDYDSLRKEIEVQPSITLIELLYNVFWELSFFGSPECRDEQKADLKRTIAEYEQSKADGTLEIIPSSVAEESVLNNLKKDLRKK